MLIDNGPVAPAKSASHHWISLMAPALPGLAAVWAFGVWHLSSTSFWYDESMQFWMSLGVDAFGPPHTPPGELWDAIRNNAVANLDPGGFTFILRYWLRLGTGGTWQRLLPFLFFAAGIAGMGWIGWSQRKSVPFTLLCSAVPALFPLILDYATEVRAYSMEFAGIVIGCALLDRLAERPSTRTALIAGTIFGFFLTARYSFALFAIAACLTLAYDCLHRGMAARRANCWYLLAFLGPIVCSGVVIFALALWPQYEARITYNGGELIQYLAAAAAAGKSAGEIATLVTVNLLHPAGLPLTVAAFVGLVALIPRTLSAGIIFDKLVMRVSASGLASFGLLCLAAIVLTALVWRWHPWDITRKWSLWLQALSAVAVVRLAAGMLGYVGQTNAAGWEENRKTAVLMLAAMLALDLRLALYRRPLRPTFGPALAYLEQLSPPVDSVAADIWTYPTIRYFYEHGSFASSRLYPTSFRLPYWNGPKPLVAEQTRYLITGLTLDAAKQMFAPATIIHDPGLPELLFRVDWTAKASHEQ
jgi:uncharacterized membrane protein